MKRLLPILTLAVFFAAAPAGRAMNLVPLLKDTPAELFTAKDYELFDTALRKAISELGKGAAVSWENPETLAGGSITVVEEYQHEGNACKRLRIENRARQRAGHSAFDFCHQPDGRWVLAPMGK